MRAIAQPAAACHDSGMKPRIGEQLLYLSNADVAACGVTADEMNASLEAMFRAKAEKRAWMQPKMLIARPGGTSFCAKGGVLSEPDYGAVKWFGYFPGNDRFGRPDFLPLIILNEGESGMPVAVMHGTWISGLRTGSLTAVAAKYMARPDVKSVGFVACGLQARSNFAALMAVLPLKRAVLYSRRRATADAFAAEVRAAGVEAAVVERPIEAVEGLDIVVSSVPHGMPENPLLDATWVSPGAFVSMVELGYAWRRESMTVFDRVVTDDVEQSAPGGAEQLNYQGAYAGEIADLVSGRIGGRLAANERNALVFSGIGLADAAPAAVVYEKAVAKELGTILPL
jgi:ornithine cyclodeaminase/alanine dehydrogenase-like protein (mu-crystallin family)